MRDDFISELCDGRRMASCDMSHEDKVCTPSIGTDSQQRKQRPERDTKYGVTLPGSLVALLAKYDWYPDQNRTPSRTSFSSTSTRECWCSPLAKEGMHATLHSGLEAEGQGDNKAVGDMSRWLLLKYWKNGGSQVHRQLNLLNNILPNTR